MVRTRNLYDSVAESYGTCDVYGVRDCERQGRDHWVQAQKSGSAHSLMQLVVCAKVNSETTFHHAFP